MFPSSSEYRLSMYPCTVDHHNTNLLTSFRHLIKTIVIQNSHVFNTVYPCTHLYGVLTCAIEIKNTTNSLCLATKYK